MLTRRGIVLGIVSNTTKGRLEALAGILPDLKSGDFAGAHNWEDSRKRGVFGADWNLGLQSVFIIDEAPVDPTGFAGLRSLDAAWPASPYCFRTRRETRLIRYRRRTAKIATAGRYRIANVRAKAHESSIDDWLEICS